jgi:hypothetical protein
MTEGLKKIYGKEFVVGRPHMTGNPGFGYHYEAKAHPKDKPEIKFTVAYNMNEKGDYGDDYLEMLWSYQGEQELREILKKQYGDNFYIFRYWLRYNNHEYKSLNHPDILKASDGWAHLWIEYYVFTNKPVVKKSEAEKIYNILDKFILKYRLKKYRIIVGYSTNKYKNNTDIYHQEYTNRGRSSDELYKDGILDNYIDIEQLAMKESEIIKLDINDVVSSFK